LAAPIPAVSLPFRFEVRTLLVLAAIARAPSSLVDALHAIQAGDRARTVVGRAQTTCCR